MLDVRFGLNDNLPSPDANYNAFKSCLSASLPLFMFRFYPNPDGSSCS